MAQRILSPSGLCKSGQNETNVMMDQFINFSFMAQLGEYCN